MKQKAQNIIAIAREMADSNYPDFNERHRLTYLACSVYRARYGKRPSQAVIDYAIYKIAW